MFGKKIEEIREKFMKTFDSDSNYTQDDFDKEFSTVNYNNDTFKLTLNFVNKSTNPNPEYATSGSSGFDLRANLEKPYILESGKFTVIPTGLYFEIPNGFEIQIRPRSGLAAKNGVTVLNTPGTIDADYRGEIKVILINHGYEAFQINNGDRIAQAVIASVVNKSIFNLKQVDEISDNTERSTGGFGSTGIN